MSDQLYDRHVRFATTAGGIWGEPVRVVSGLRRDATAAVLTPQFEGTLTPALSTWPTTVSSEIDQLPVWADFTLDQLSSEYFTIAKRTTGGRSSSFLTNAGQGTRAAGLGYVGGASGGGVVFALRGTVLYICRGNAGAHSICLQTSGKALRKASIFEMPAVTLQQSQFGLTVQG